MLDFRTTSPALSLPVVIHALRIAVAAWGGRRLLGAMLVHLLYQRLEMIRGRLERMMIRFAAGRVMRRRPRAGTAGIGEDDRPGRRRMPAAAGRIWPTAFGWLVTVAAHEAAGLAGHLRLVLEHPEMVALLEALPEAGRMLRPVCRALGIETSLLRLPQDKPAAHAAAVAPDTPPPKAAAPKHVRTVDIGRVPLPRGVRAAVRRQRSRADFSWSA